MRDTRFLSLALIAFTACTGTDEPTKVDDSGVRDAGTADGGFSTDAMPAPDATVATGDAGTTDGGTADGGIVEDAGSVDAGNLPRGACRDANDCGGTPCLRIPDEEGGYNVCANVPAPEATMCVGQGVDQCCTSAECTAQPSGRCYFGPRFYCGGAAPQPGNECFYDECTTRADCTAMPNGVCVPREAFGEVNNRCVYGGCVFDSDCTEGGLPECTPFFNPCNDRFIGFSCTYDRSPCRADKDCADTPNGFCFPGDNGNTECRSFVPPP